VGDCSAATFALVAHVHDHCGVFTVRCGKCWGTIHAVVFGGASWGAWSVNVRVVFRVEDDFAFWFRSRSRGGGRGFFLGDVLGDDVFSCLHWLTLSTHLLHPISFQFFVSCIKNGQDGNQGSRKPSFMHGNQAREPRFP